MRKIINKTQQKIYAIWRKAKQHISSFVGVHAEEPKS